MLLAVSTDLTWRAMSWEHAKGQSKDSGRKRDSVWQREFALNLP